MFNNIFTTAHRTGRLSTEGFVRIVVNRGNIYWTRSISAEPVIILPKNTKKPAAERELNEIFWGVRELTQICISRARHDISNLPSTIDPRPELVAKIREIREKVLSFVSEKNFREIWKIDQRLKSKTMLRRKSCEAANWVDFRKIREIELGIAKVKILQRNIMHAACRFGFYNDAVTPSWRHQDVII